MEWIWFRIDRMIGDEFLYGGLGLEDEQVWSFFRTLSWSLSLLPFFPSSLSPFISVYVPDLSTLSLRFGCHTPWLVFFSFFFPFSFCSGFCVCIYISYYTVLFLSNRGRSLGLLLRVVSLGHIVTATSRTVMIYAWRYRLIFPSHLCPPSTTQSTNFIPT